MTRGSRTFVIGSLVTTCLLASGCAVGGGAGAAAEDIAPVSEELDAALGHGDETDAASLREADAAAEQAGADAGRDAPDVDASTDGREQDAGTHEPDAGADEPDVSPPEAPSCEPTSGCHAARYLGELSGDRASKTNAFAADGTQSEWLSVRVREDSNGNKELRFRAVLSSTEGSNYDLFVYVPDSADAVACEAPSDASTDASGLDDIDLSWDDAWLGNDDSRTVTLEVRHVSGSCAPWTLEVRGP